MLSASECARELLKPIAAELGLDARVELQEAPPKYLTAGLSST
jgi:hypothetical protein